MNFTPGTTFAEFKEDFYRKTEDLSLYDCGDINIIKVVLDGLKVNYTARGSVRTPFFLPTPLWNLDQALRRKKHGSPKIAFRKNEKAKVLFADLSGRSETEKAGQPESYYFDKLLSQHRPTEYVHVVEHFKKTEYPHDLDLRDFFFLQYTENNGEAKELRKNLLNTFARLRRSGLFDANELMNIRIAIQSFFAQYRIWDELLEHYPHLQHAVLEQHYHHEGLILALKRRNIKTYEIQHGLISESDIFYVFPRSVQSIRSRALFPDKILTYGNYWKKVLLKGSEFASEQIEITGDFRSKNDKVDDPAEKNRIDQFAANSKVILISSQTFMHDHYIAHTKRLSELLSAKYPGWKIILKLHPNEKEASYADLLPFKNVLVTKGNILHLFSLASIHISVYSTTLFDALEYKIANFSLILDAYKDYTDQIIQDNIAQPLLYDEDPIAKLDFTHSKAPLLASDIFAPFSVNTYKDLFLN